ncbi:MAG TPA: phosphoribosylglycinamide formyltransferase [Longimicrobiales bacterium]|nr:phosphoribosylglycinamide formyltransferase [Longimicrobiales bacterium]
MSGAAPLVAAVFASGGGSNLQALLDHRAADPPWQVGLLVSDRPGAGALARAQAARVPHRVISTKGRTSDDVAAETLAALAHHGVQVVYLAGYLKLLPAPVVQAFSGRILNIHPALLPAFGGKGMWGMHVHQAVLASGARLSGPTVHLVDEEYDRGRILAQWPVPVLPGDTPESLASRVLAVEHRLYPMTADHLCRAVIQGREPDPLSLPGETFTLVP